jgi:hypothetical protein
MCDEWRKELTMVLAQVRLRALALAAMLLTFSITGLAQDYVLLGWNDLGMHCANKDFSKIAVLPPYNTVRAQLIKRADGVLPRTVTAGYKIEYSIPTNSTSVTKTNFWQYAQTLFGLAQPLPPDVGLAGKGLSGVMDPTDNYFEARGIPVTPFADSNLTTEAPYQLIHLVARVIATDSIVATTDVVIPVSNEIGCVQAGCHASETAILNAHESVSGFNRSGPVLCASCHSSNALGTTGTTAAGPFSYRIHRQHRSIAGAARDIATCYKCHPGPKTQCFRDVMRVGITSPLICQDCHGTMDTVANAIANRGRRPWLDEPKCGSCHGATYSEETGKLFRESRGHGKIFCSGCHGSPHAIVPTREPNDNLQSNRLQGYAGPIRMCNVCHQNMFPAGGPHGLGVTSVVTRSAEAPSGFVLRQNFPNPFNPSTTIRFEVPDTRWVSLVIYNALGEQIRTLSANTFTTGAFNAIWDGLDDESSQAPSGIYFCRMIAVTVNGRDVRGVKTIKMMLIR